MAVNKDINFTQGSFWRLYYRHSRVVQVFRTFDDQYVCYDINVVSHELPYKVYSCDPVEFEMLYELNID